MANLVGMIVLDKYVSTAEFLIWSSLLNSKILRGHAFLLSFYNRCDAVLSFYEATVWSDGRRLVLIHRLRELHRPGAAHIGEHQWEIRGAAGLTVVVVVAFVLVTGSIQNKRNKSS